MQIWPKDFHTWWQFEETCEIWASLVTCNKSNSLRHLLEQFLIAMSLEHTLLCQTMHLFVIHIASNFFSHFKRQIICPLAFFSYFIGVLKIFQLLKKNIPIFFNCPFRNSLEKTLHIAIGLSLANYA